MKKVLEVKNLKRTAQDNQEKKLIFKNISFQIQNNEFVCIFGKSGSGKTTLLNTISGLQQPDSGLIHFSKKNPSVGYVFQEDRLLPWLSVEENIMLVLKKNKKLSRKTKVKRVKDYLKMVGLEKISKSYPGYLSGGEKQRIAIARALVINPDILLMDEPFSHLDEITARGLRSDVKKICKKEKTPIIFVTHNPIEALYFADKIIVISKEKKTVSKIIKVPKVLSSSKDYYETLINHPEAKSLINELVSFLD